jgi:hypothetical protein
MCFHKFKPDFRPKFHVSTIPASTGLPRRLSGIKDSTFLEPALVSKCLVERKKCITFLAILSRGLRSVRQRRRSLLNQQNPGCSWERSAGEFSGAKSSINRQACAG